MASASVILTQTHNIFTASLHTNQIPQFLLHKLHPVLPYSLPLYGRCQFHLHQCASNDNPKPSGQLGQPEVWVAVAVPKQSTPTSPKEWIAKWLESPYAPPQPDHNDNSNEETSEYWLSCYLDLRQPGQTQVWAFGSWEFTISPQLFSNTTTTSSDASTSPKTHFNPLRPTETQMTLARALHHRLRTHHVPRLSQTPSAQYTTMKEAGKIVSSPYKRSKVLFGTLAEASWWIVSEGLIKGQTSSTTSASSTEKQALRVISAREDRPYLKYIAKLPLSETSVPSIATDSTDETRELEFAPLDKVHLQTMLDRSPIPRTIELLQSLVSVGLFPSDSPDPVAWGILGKDASVSSLHTEPGYRGKGLAERVARELVRMMPTKFMDAGDGEGEAEYMHVDVSPENRASQRVCEKLGAKVLWRAGWVEVDVGEG